MAHQPTCQDSEAQLLVLVLVLLPLLLLFLLCNVPVALSQLFINNKWVDAKQGGKLDVVDPRTGDTIKQIASAGERVGGWQPCWVLH